MTEPNGEATARLATMRKEWAEAEERAAAARENVRLTQQTLIGAEAEALIKQARFKGAAELLYGKDATFGYDEKTGDLSFSQPNRETRRARAKKRKQGASVPVVK